MLGHNFAPLADGNSRDLPHVLFTREINYFEKNMLLSIENFSLLYYPGIR